MVVVVPGIKSRLATFGAAPVLSSYRLLVWLCTMLM